MHRSDTTPDRVSVSSVARLGGFWIWLCRFPLWWQRLMVVSWSSNLYFPPVKWKWEVSRADRANVYLFIDRNQMEDFPSGKDLAVGPCLVGWLRSLNSFKSYRLHASNQNLLACQTFICQIYNNIVYTVAVLVDSVLWQCEWCMALQMSPPQFFQNS